MTSGHFPEHPDFQRELWLRGQPPLGRYVEYVEDLATGDKVAARQRAATEWREANDTYYALETEEAGIADKPSTRPLPASAAAMAAEIEADPRYRNAFGELANRIALVELDTLIVPQSHINLDHVERLKQRLGKKRGIADLMTFCLPLGREEAQVEARQIGKRKFLFWSHSSDFRFQKLSLLEPGQVQPFHDIGPIAKVLALSVGYGSNFLTVIESDNRILLHNGHHRAYALKAMGVTWAPAIIQTVTRRDELNLAASGNVTEDPAFFFKYPRPPLLKDFFDPRLSTVLHVPPTVRTIEVSVEITDYETRDFSAAALKR